MKNNSLLYAVKNNRVLMWQIRVMFHLRELTLGVIMLIFTMQDPAFYLQALSPCESIQDSGIQGFKRSEGRAKRDPELLVYIYI